MKLENVDIVLVRPRFPENIGAAARSMKNMGLGRLVLVSPQNCDLKRVVRMATSQAIDIVEEMEIFCDLKDACSIYNLVAGTTARLGKQRRDLLSPFSFARAVAPVTAKNRVAVLFGPEDRGLTNEDLRLCHWLINIPTADFSSINLAQAVMIICYSLCSSTIKEQAGHVPRLASRHELDGMYEQLKDLLVRIDFIKPDNPDYWMNRLRHFFTRMRLRASDVSIIRGICRQVDWYAEKRYKDGLKDAAKSPGTAEPQKGR